MAEFPEVLVVSDGGDTKVGAPYVEGAKVLAEVKSHYRDKKIIVFKYKAEDPLPAHERPSPGIHRLQVQEIQVG